MEKPAKKKRVFVVLDENNQDTKMVLTTRQNPALAARKAARRGITDIRLRERGKRKVRHYTGSVVEVTNPPNAPEWLPKNPKVGKAVYVGIYMIDRDGNVLAKKPVGKAAKKKAAAPSNEEKRNKEIEAAIVDLEHEQEGSPAENPV